VKVHIKLFGTYRKYLPSSAQGSTYSMNVPVGIVIEELRDQVPLPVDEKLVVLINGRSPKIGQVLKEDDTIAFFPAMAGG
jgi:molybdopterin converting factor small subunit